MPFKPKELAILAYAGGFTLYHYKTDDDVLEKGYFNKARATVKPADLLIISSKGPRTKFLTVISSADMNVVVAPVGSEDAFIKQVSAAAAPKKDADAENPVSPPSTPPTKPKGK